jgi:hypothetical protein
LGPREVFITRTSHGGGTGALFCYHPFFANNNETLEPAQIGCVFYHFPPTIFRTNYNCHGSLRRSHEQRCFHHFFDAIDFQCEILPSEVILSLHLISKSISQARVFVLGLTRSFSIKASHGRSGIRLPGMPPPRPGGALTSVGRPGSDCHTQQ